jgi:hypothetical protein
VKAYTTQLSTIRHKLQSLVGRYDEGAIEEAKALEQFAFAATSYHPTHSHVANVLWARLLTLITEDKYSEALLVVGELESL